MAQLEWGFGRQMFYETAVNDHGLPHDPFKALIVPRPIGWISSVNKDGAVNLAPYSFFNGFSSRPPIVGFASEGRKDTLEFIEETKEFVCNLATFDFRKQVHTTSAFFERGESEFARAGIVPTPSTMVRPPRVSGIAAALECKWLQTMQLTALENRNLDQWLVLGQVVGIYIDDRFIKRGLVDTAKMQPIARLGYRDYAALGEIFSVADSDDAT